MTTGLIILASGMLLALGGWDLPGTTSQAMFALLTISGAIMASAIAFMVNPTKESNWVKVGRASFAGFVGMVGPRTLGYFWEGFRTFVESDQTFMLASGFFFGLGALWTCIPFIRTGERRSQFFVDKVFDWGQTRFIPGNAYQTRLDQERQAAEAAAKLKDNPPS